MCYYIYTTAGGDYSRPDHESDSKERRDELKNNQIRATAQNSINNFIISKILFLKQNKIIMKKLLFLLLTAFCFAACQQPKKQYFESSPEIDIVKKTVTAYLSQDWGTFRSMYADTAKIAVNVWAPDKFITLDKHMENEKAGAENFTDIKISNDIIYNMIISDKGEKWVLMWFNWSAKTKNGVEVSTPVHEGLRFVGDKVVFHFANFNELPIYLALQPADSVVKK